MGKTQRFFRQRAIHRKHPHVHGEDFPLLGGMREGSETPPRAWGRRISRIGKFDNLGNTPTCMGKTLEFTGLSGFFGRF